MIWLVFNGLTRRLTSRIFSLNYMSSFDIVYLFLLRRVEDFFRLNQVPALTYEIRAVADKLFLLPNRCCLDCLTSFDICLGSECCCYKELISIVDQRKQYKPLPYILGKVSFLGLELEIEPPILIPRVETEEWVAHLIQVLESSLITSASILDLCSGSGCISLGIAKKISQVNVVGVDIDPRAVSLAKRNRAKLGLENVNFLQGDLLNPVKDSKFDIIISNPPYISKKREAEIEKNVLDWESRLALFAEDDGLFFYKQIINNAKSFLNPPRPNFGNVPQLVLEFDPGQEVALVDLLGRNGFSYSFYKDCFGRERYVFCWLKPNAC